ncbi:MAG: HAD family hydrolase [Bacteroidota bacterium]
MADPLASWNEGAAKQSIVGFVKEVTDKTNPDYVPVPDRIAVFDNDGTLWSERPVYFQFYFVIDRVKALAPQHPEWKREQPFKAALDNDMDALVASGKKGLMQLLLSTHAGMTTTEFEQIVTEWIINAKHPTTGKLYKEMVYQPMLELLDYLRTNGFKTYIISGGGIEFLRPWAEEAYGIPPEQVVGSSIKTKFELRDGKPVIVRLPEIDFIDDKAGKPVGIHKFIGKRPIVSCGNSDGDLQMMQWTAGGDGSRLMLYVHHTDAEREWAYDRDSHVGRFDKGLDEAREKGWTIVDMKKDWRVIFPFQLH